MGADIFVIILQAVLDVDNPECVIDGLLSHQAAEQRKGDTGVFADDITVSLLIDIVEAGNSHCMYQKFSRKLNIVLFIELFYQKCTIVQWEQ